MKFKTAEEAIDYWSHGRKGPEAETVIRIGGEGIDIWSNRGVDICDILRKYGLTEGATASLNGYNVFIPSQDTSKASGVIKSSKRVAVGRQRGGLGKGASDA